MKSLVEQAKEKYKAGMTVRTVDTIHSSFDVITLTENDIASIRYYHLGESVGIPRGGGLLYNNETKKWAEIISTDPNYEKIAIDKLIKEAKTRYKPGDIIITLYSSGDACNRRTNITKEDLQNIRKYASLQVLGVPRHPFYLYVDGKWAEKVGREDVPESNTTSKDLTYGREILGFPKKIVEKMLHYQVQQGNARDVTVFEENSKAKANGFDWERTPEGYDFWYDVIRNRKFSLFFERYPKSSSSPSLSKPDTPSSDISLKRVVTKGPKKNPDLITRIENVTVKIRTASKLRKSL